jgi:type IV secretion system protein VirB11
VPRRLIADAIELIVFIEGRGTARRIAAIEGVEGMDSAGDYAVRAIIAEPRPVTESPTA